MGRWIVLACVIAGCATDLATIDQRATVCADSATTVRGMDVSYYDTVTDWSAARAAGIEFANVRATDGTQYTDSKFAGYWAGAKAAGVLRGAYQFFRPAEDAIAQADLLLQMLGSDRGELPPVLDVEVSGGLAPAQVASAVQAWVAHVAAAIGRPPIIYAGLYSWPTLTGGADDTASPLWVAQYTTAPCPDIPAPWTRWAIWQDSSTGSSAGVANPGTLDIDVFNGTHDQLLAFAGGAPAPCGTIAAAGGEIGVADACFVAGGPPQFLRHVTGAGAHGTLIWTHATPAAAEANFAQWDLYFAAGGSYVVAAYTDHAYATSRQAGYAVRAAGAATTVVIDQSAVDGWQTLGTFAFAAGGDQWIHLSDNTGEPAAANAQLVFDAIRVTPVDHNGSGSGSSGESDDTVRGGCSSAGNAGAPIAWALVLALAMRRRKRGDTPAGWSRRDA
jgi:uncharacterized protein (TIGR03382 family)